MTKANEKARAAVADAERRAKAKVRRLSKKGISTGNINPIKPVDSSDTWALKRYHSELEQFISRQTRFVRGYGGTPIPYAAYRDFRRLERQWNKLHNRYWRDFAAQPFITAYGETDTTMEMRSRMGHVKGLPFGDVDYERMTPAERIKGLKDLQKRREILEQELSPQFQQKRIRELRANLLKYADTFNDPRIPNAIKKLTNEQIFALQNFTDFVPLYYRYVNTDRDNQVDTVIDAIEDEAQKEHLLLTIKRIKKMKRIGKAAANMARRGTRSAATIRQSRTTKPKKRKPKFDIE